MDPKAAEASNIKVCVRVRPFNAREKSKHSMCIVKMYKNSTIITNPETLSNPIAQQQSQVFTYDHSFWSTDNVTQPMISQQDVFHAVGLPIVDNVLDGYNSCIFAYGQTGCLDPNTKVIMFDQSVKKVKDVSIGDQLMGDDWTPRNVMKLYEGEDEMFDICNANTNQMIYRVNQNHILTLLRKNSNMVVDIIDINLQDYLKEKKCSFVENSVSFRGIRKPKPMNIVTYPIKVRYAGRGKYNGFLLDNNHRFLLEDYTVTHNTGKSWNITGGNTEETKGLVPRICENLFQRIDKMGVPSSSSSSSGSRYEVYVSYLEIYAEQIRDLIQPAQPNQSNNVSLKVREHPQTGPYVEDLTIIPAENFYAVNQFMMFGNKHRITAATKMNDNSSRSHAVFTVYIHQFDQDNKETMKSKLCLVDLAGSERVKDSGVTGIHLKEAAEINTSLTTLGRVISALAKNSSEPNSKPTFVPFRDSVLTWLLKDSLGGNSKTVMIAAISPADINYEETLNTLQYASRAKQIVNKVTVNTECRDRLIASLQSEMEQLNGELNRIQGINFLDISERLKHMEEIKERMKEKQELISTLSSIWETRIYETQQLQSQTFEEYKKHKNTIKHTLQVPFLVDASEYLDMSRDLIHYLPMGEKVGSDIHPLFECCTFIHDTDGQVTVKIRKHESLTEMDKTIFINNTNVIHSSTPNTHNTRDTHNTHTDTFLSYTLDHGDKIHNHDQTICFKFKIPIHAIR